ncbi:hypothetical protein WJX73_000918 [Symbiochloris irregularis]|uniref:Uncharacterized protein n=1 Tax=Symbiochloris irregularis TaxID=706552 RepID=A0AAW1PGA1_9CHLO
MMLRSRQPLQASGLEASLQRHYQPQLLNRLLPALLTRHSNHTAGLWQNSVPALLAALILALASPAEAGVLPRAPGVASKAFGNIPESLDSAVQKVPEHLGELLRGKSVEDCARKCIGTCIRGGQGAPGLGPMSMRREIVVFKDGFRSRTYCLSECTQVCALMAKNKQ